MTKTILLLLAAMAAGLLAQDSTLTKAKIKAEMDSQIRVFTTTASVSGTVVKGAPYSATEVWS